MIPFSQLAAIAQHNASDAPSGGNFDLLDFDGTDDFVSADIGTFYADNDIITVGFTVWRTASTSRTYLTLGADNSNLLHVFSFSAGSQIRFVAEIGASNFVSLSPAVQLGVYSVTLNKTAETLDVTMPDGTELSDSLTSEGFAGRGDGDLHIGQRPDLADARTDGIVSDVTLYDENGVLQHQYRGHGPTDADWRDLIGTAHGTVSGSPAAIKRGDI